MVLKNSELFRVVGFHRLSQKVQNSCRTTENLSTHQKNIMIFFSNLEFMVKPFLVLKSSHQSYQLKDNHLSTPNLPKCM